MIKDGGYHVPLKDRIEIAGRLASNASWYLKQRGSHDALAVIDLFFLALTETTLRQIHAAKEEGNVPGVEELSKHLRRFVHEARELEAVLGTLETDKGPEILLTDHPAAIGDLLLQ